MATPTAQAGRARTAMDTCYRPWVGSVLGWGERGGGEGAVRGCICMHAYVFTFMCMHTVVRARVYACVCVAMCVHVNVPWSPGSRPSHSCRAR